MKLSEEVSQKRIWFGREKSTGPTKTWWYATIHQKNQNHQEYHNHHDSWQITTTTTSSTASSSSSNPLLPAGFIGVIIAIIMMATWTVPWPDDPNMMHLFIIADVAGARTNCWPLSLFHTKREYDVDLSISVCAVSCSSQSHAGDFATNPFRCRWLQ